MDSDDTLDLLSVTSDDPERPEYRMQHDFDGRYELSTTIIMALSELEERADTADPLSQSLINAIDPDCLDGLFRPVTYRTDRNRGTVRFPFGGYTITVHADGEVRIRPETHDAGADEAPSG